MRCMRLASKTCTPCEGGVPPLSNADEDRYLRKIDGWELDRSGVHRIRKEFTFRDFKQALTFVNSVRAEQEGHHPRICFTWGKATVEIWTHAVNGLTENDFILAAKIDASFSQESTR